MLNNKTLKEMTTQAQNSLKLYKGGNPSTIEQLLQFQKKEIVSELMQHFNCYNVSELAVRLSIGK